MKNLLYFIRWMYPYFLKPCRNGLSNRKKSILKSINFSPVYGNLKENIKGIKRVLGEILKFRLISKVIYVFTVIDFWSYRTSKVRLSENKFNLEKITSWSLYWDIIYIESTDFSRQEIVGLVVTALQVYFISSFDLLWPSYMRQEKPVKLQGEPAWKKMWKTFTINGIGGRGSIRDKPILIFIYHSDRVGKCGKLYITSISLRKRKEFDNRCVYPDVVVYTYTRTAFLRSVNNYYLYIV